MLSLLGTLPILSFDYELVSLELSFFLEAEFEVPTPLVDDEETLITFFFSWLLFFYTEVLGLFLTSSLFDRTDALSADTTSSGSVSDAIFVTTF